jgi:hypothetical protein
VLQCINFVAIPLISTHKVDGFRRNFGVFLGLFIAKCFVEGMSEFCSALLAADPVLGESDNIVEKLDVAKSVFQVMRYSSLTGNA